MSIYDFHKDQKKLTKYMPEQQKQYWDKVLKTRTEMQQMANVRDEAKAYEPKTTKNVSDLEVFNITSELELFEGTDNTGKPFTYQYVVIEDEKYRVPTSVLSQIKTHLEEKSDLTEVKVKKKGEGLNTEYTVIPVK